MRVALTEEEGEDEIGVRVGGRVVNNLRYVDDTTLIAETEQGLKTLVKRVVLKENKGHVKHRNEVVFIER